ncbi:hypothetical protein [Metallibacterium sp.]|uniref:hypothetical protein n=1 Tax=Metallibacterium sp. TaxID=2940281 RepID=UPI00263908E4|nr:hypothetical protein [Metallibacterium sp.]
MNIAAILQKHGIVPVAPVTARPTGTPQTQAGRHVPAVPVVPVPKNEGGSGDAIPALQDAAQIARQRTRLLAEPPASPTPDHSDLRARLLRIAATCAVPAEIVHAIATDAALSFCLDMTDAELTRWLNIVGTREMHARGLLRSGQWAIPSVADVPP